MKLLLTFATVFILSFSASAKDIIDYKSLEAEGFGKVSKILQNMTPQQRAEVMRQTEKLKKDFGKISGDEQDQLKQQMLMMQSNINSDGVDTSKLDPKKSKDLKSITKDIKTYNKHYGN